MAAVKLQCAWRMRSAKQGWRYAIILYAEVAKSMKVAATPWSWFAKLCKETVAGAGSPKPAVQLPIPVAVRPAAAAATGYEEDISRALTSPPSMPRCHTPNRTSQEWRPDPKAQINRIVGEVKVLGSCPGSVNTRPLKSHELQRDVSRSRASAEEPPVAAHLQVHQECIRLLALHQRLRQQLPPDHGSLLADLVK
ncbi:unnamed protein product, partial [Polarella glacialis]